MPVCNETKQLSAAPEGVSWGTTNTPVGERVNVQTEYTTRDGRPVFGLEIVLHNSCGREVTYPVKGYIEGKTKSGRRKAKWSIWTLDGRAGLLKGSPEDLVAVDG